MDRESKRVSGGLQAICAGMKERAAHAGVALRTLRKCYSEAMRQARLVENDRLAQKHYLKFYIAGDLTHPVTRQEMPQTTSTAAWKELPVASVIPTDSGVQELNVQAAGEKETIGQL